ncbi:hypothetical protein [Sutcliffiella horikoshii]|uniref:hypothetical protein n=1 Tax=Sutcliffiella horikoshii TaxID=79883 RepID=UPI001CFDEE8E|nr:hypothetical protein [Sutcliffiella horikoshii]
MSYMTFGSMTISTSLVVMVIALMVLPVVYKLATRRAIPSFFWDNIFLYFVIWKLSYIVIHPKLFLEMPMSILYFHGGDTGKILGLIFVFLNILMSRNLLEQRRSMDHE